VNTGSSSSASKLAHSISVLDAVMWIVEAVKQVSPETVKSSCFQKEKFILGGNENVEINSNDTENLQEALNHANFGNIRAEDYVNIDVDATTEADLNDINHFIEDHQQAEEQDQELESEEESPIAESSVKTYSDALKHLKDLENFALTRNDSDLFETIFRVRMMTEACL
jgi:replicative superfamily II helicase